MVEDYVALISNAIETNDIAAIKDIGIDDTSARFATSDELCSALLTACSGKTLVYELSPQSFDVNNPIYNILCDDTVIARLQLTLISETVKLGFLSIPEWEPASFSLSSETLGISYTLSVPDDFTVTANGILLTEDDVVSEENGIFAYYAEGFVGQPVFQVKDAFGVAARTGQPELLSEGEKSADIYSVSVDYERFDLALPADFSFALSAGTVHSEKQENRTVYSIYTAEPIDLAFMEEHVTASDSVGNPLGFSESAGSILPVYSEYTITAADCYRVHAGDTLLDIAQATLTPLATTQYQDEPISLATYSIGLAKEVEFQIIDALNNPVAYETASNTVNVPLFDCSVTVPDNFTILINGKSSEALPVVKDNSGYQYIAEYTTVPKLNEYRFEGLAKIPTITVTDNLSSTEEYIMPQDGTLVITEQKGLDALPDSLSTQLDPIAIAKKWSLFMTDDLEGSLNGYYNMRDYLVRGSYYDTVAYQWATNIDITFISDHYFRDPAFSKESVSNVVLYGDNCFSCDIYFEKHMTLTRTGKLQDDIFHRRMYFICIDDTDDGTENPHWVIADMQEIQ